MKIVLNSLLFLILYASSIILKIFHKKSCLYIVLQNYTKIVLSHRHPQFPDALVYYNRVAS